MLHRDKKHRLVALTLYGQNGHVLARQTFVFRAAPQHKRIRRPGHVIRPAPRPLPATPPVRPSAPLQRGSADGFSVVVGHNGAVQFTETHATPTLERLAGHNISFDCFRLTKEFGIFTVRSQGQGGLFASTVGLRLQGIGGPIDGCEILAPFGRRWPDPLGEHAAVEIALTPAGRRYFENRAAARDLALFVRSRRMHQLRKEPAARALEDIEAIYGRELAHSPIRITLVAPETLQFSETSPTGRHFHVTIRSGRITGQNLKPFGFVF